MTVSQVITRFDDPPEPVRVTTNMVGTWDIRTIGCGIIAWRRLKTHL
ncbi:hypothetical protein [Actinokineospora xionganensis]|uniref:Uncharacterized protein n=1 Tax=Actinokineospora xionganensis TaxID=2684470 RepID=A0ABR7L020_9PSEU|nr:hypothetical protein [Actinokineospora xionganensis]MBC6446023.1 hypothetical protein [Actinokineospora xionganensis]